MIRRLMATSATWITLPIRLALGSIFVAHGAQKVLGSFNGPGWSKFISFPAPFAFMRPGWLWMAAAALGELVGGALILLGLLTRFGAFLIICIMLTAMFGVHWKNGFFLQNSGVEYIVALLGMALALLIAGGGQLSVDRMLGRRRR